MSVEFLEKVEMNNSYEWVLIRGRHKELPLLIHTQAGPGLPMISEADSMEMKLKLEEHFLNVYRDQRGCGKSFNQDLQRGTVNLQNLTNDLIACAEFVLNKFKKQTAFAAGYSVGASIALMAASKRHDLFSHLVLAGTDVDVKTANVYALNNAFNMTEVRNNKKLNKALNELRATGTGNANSFQKRAKILADLGVIKSGAAYSDILYDTLKNLLSCKYYSLTDVFKTIRGMNFCQNELLPELNTLNMFNSVKSVDVPVTFVQGAKDGVAPRDTVFRYYEYLKAPAKEFVLYENSAHLPHLEEPDKFRELLTDLARK